VSVTQAATRVVSFELEETTKTGGRCSPAV